MALEEEFVLRANTGELVQALEAAEAQAGDLDSQFRALSEAVEGMNQPATRALDALKRLRLGLGTLGPDKAAAEVKRLEMQLDALSNAEREAVNRELTAFLSELGTQSANASKQVGGAAKAIGGAVKSQRAQNMVLAEGVNQASELAFSIGTVVPSMREFGTSMAMAGNNAFVLISRLGPLGLGIGALTAALPFLIKLFADSGEEAENTAKSLDELLEAEEKLRNAVIARIEAQEATAGGTAPDANVQGIIDGFQEIEEANQRIADVTRVINGLRDEFNGKLPFEQRLIQQKIDAQQVLIEQERERIRAIAAVVGEQEEERLTMLRQQRVIQAISDGIIGLNEPIESATMAFNAFAQETGQALLDVQQIEDGIRAAVKATEASANRATVAEQNQKDLRVAAGVSDSEPTRRGGGGRRSDLVSLEDLQRLSPEAFTSLLGSLDAEQRTSLLGQLVSAGLLDERSLTVGSGGVRRTSARNAARQAGVRALSLETIAGLGEEALASLLAGLDPEARLGLVRAMIAAGYVDADPGTVGVGRPTEDEPLIVRVLYDVENPEDSPAALMRAAAGASVSIPVSQPGAALPPEAEPPGSATTNLGVQVTGQEDVEALREQLADVQLMLAMRYDLSVDADLPEVKAAQDEIAALTQQIDGLLVPIDDTTSAFEDVTDETGRALRNVRQMAAAAASAAASARSAAFGGGPAQAPLVTGAGATVAPSGGADASTLGQVDAALSGGGAGTQQAAGALLDVRDVITELRSGTSVNDLLTLDTAPATIDAALDSFLTIKETSAALRSGISGDVLTAMGLPPERLEQTRAEMEILNGAVKAIQAGNLDLLDQMGLRPDQLQEAVAAVQALGESWEGASLAADAYNTATQVGAALFADTVDFLINKNRLLEDERQKALDAGLTASEAEAKAEKEVQEARKQQIKTLLANFAVQQAFEGAALIAEGIAATITNPPEAAAKFAGGGIKLALAAAAGGASAAIPSGGGGGGRAGAQGRGQPDGQRDNDEGGGGDVTVIVNFNQPQTEAEIGRNQELAARAARRRFGR